MMTKALMDLVTTVPTYFMVHSQMVRLDANGVVLKTVSLLVLNCVNKCPIATAPAAIPAEAGIQFSRGSGPRLSPG
jgi:hypothetical protein